MLLNYLYKNKSLFVLYLVLAPINALVEVGLAYTMSVAVDFAMNGKLSDISQYIFSFIFYVFLSFLTGYATANVRFHLLEIATGSLKANIHSCITRVWVQDFQSYNSSSYLADLTVNMDMIRDSWFDTLLQLYPNTVKFIVATMAMFLLSPLLGFYVVIFAAIQAVIPSYFTKHIADLGKVAAVSQESHIAMIRENFQLLETAQSFGVIEFLNKRQSNSCRIAEHARYKLKAFNRFSYELSFAIGNVIYLGIFLLGAILVLSARLNIAAVIAASQLMVYIASPLTTIGGDLAEIKSVSKVLEKINTVLSFPSKSNGFIKKERFDYSLKLNNLQFSFEDKLILKNVNYTFEKGKKYLIIGESGSGKSTLLRIIANIFPCLSGSITLDNINIVDIVNDDYCKLVTLISQDSYLLDDTIAENVKFFLNASDEQVTDALYNAGLKEYIEKLPMGIHTKIGENAIQMSGGERQRLSARAILRGCPILLMDESTSHLDEDTASEIEKILFSLQNVTVIFVTHQLRRDTINLADEVILLENRNLNKWSG